MAKILMIRFSALGDVAMTVGIMKAFADRYPNDQIYLLSRPFIKPLIQPLPSNVHLRAVNLKDYKGLGGLIRLSCELKKEHYDMLADVHDVLRSKVIRTMFRLWGHRVAVINKGRKERKALTRSEGKQLRQLPTSFERYAQVLRSLGYPIELQPCHIYGEKPASISDLLQITGPKHTDLWIGIAPFAAHQGKIYPLEKMEQVISLLTSPTSSLQKKKEVKLFLFGSGDKEKAWCQDIESRYPKVISMVGKTNLEKELRLMTNLDLMITMDSANMHLSALCGTKTISIWGQTHPLAGFYGMQADASRLVQINDLSCRPCSIFGNKPCKFGDYRCLSRIEPEEIARLALES